MEPNGNVGAAISEQVSGQWNGVLAMMTQSGASRMDLVGLAAMTARALLTMTAHPLWPDPESVPADERPVFDTVEDINRRLGALLHALGVEP